MAIRKIPKETKYYSFYNANPFERRTGDCAVRALSLVLEKDWKDVYKELLELTLKTGWSVCSKENIEKYLKSLGYEKQKMPKKKNNTRYTGEEFAKMNPKGRFFLSIGTRHNSALVDGKIYDIWNCTKRCVGNYWIIK